MSYFREFKEFYDYLKIRKKYWLIPIFLVFLLFGSIVVLGSQTPVIAPFIYAIFNDLNKGVSKMRHEERRK